MLGPISLLGLEFLAAAAIFAVLLLLPFKGVVVALLSILIVLLAGADRLLIFTRNVSQLFVMLQGALVVLVVSRLAVRDGLG